MIFFIPENQKYTDTLHTSMIMHSCNKCGAEAPEEARFCMKCGGTISRDAEFSMDSPSTQGAGTGPVMQDVVANRSQIGMASVGSIHIGDQKVTCPVCRNIVSSDNRSLACFKCGTYFCEICESHFRRTRRKRGEAPLCRGCYADKARQVEQERHRQEQELGSHRMEVASQKDWGGQPWTSPSGIDFVFIPAGTFTMGSREFNDAKSHHVVISRPFYMGKYTVTQREWVMLMGRNPSVFQGDNLPVDSVSWHDCQGFIGNLNEREGVDGYRLPTEAEWEYACRAGSDTRFCFGNSTKTLREYSWFHDNSGREPHPVGQLEPSKWGLYDMHGNVWEWCHDWYAKTYPMGPVTDPKGPDTAFLKVFRGGCWSISALNCSSAGRRCDAPGDSDDRLGFRIVRDL